MLKNVIVQVIITFFLLIFLNFSIEYFSGKNGQIKMGPIAIINGQKYLPIGISNYTKKTINNLEISIPKHVDLRSIRSSGPIMIEELPYSIGIDTKKIIKVSGALPSRLLHLYIPVEKNSDEVLIELINKDDLNIEHVKVINIESKKKKALKEAFFISVIYSIFFGSFLFVNQHLHEKNVREARGKLEEVEKELNGIAKRLHDTEDNTARIKMLLVRRLNDYSKENDFWKNTIRKILYNKYNDKKSGDVIINEVRDMLKTYSTQGKLESDAETLRMLELLTNKKK